VPRPVTADRGYGQAAVERDLHAAGVRTVAIPHQDRPALRARAITRLLVRCMLAFIRVRRSASLDYGKGVPGGLSETQFEEI